MNKFKNFSGITKASNLIKAIANETRLLILCKLYSEESSVTDLVHYTGLSQSSISQHLANLREKQLVKTRRDQQTIYYSIDSPELIEVLKVLHKNFCQCNV
jgi:DNA-binding transcriptional ArsR family regulator